MHTSAPRARWIAAGLAVLTTAVLAYWLMAAPAGPRTLRQFDPDRMADLELRMWADLHGGVAHDRSRFQLIDTSKSLSTA